MKRKYIFSTGAIGIIFMMIGQLSFAVNDTLVKEIVIDNTNNLSVINVIFLRGLLSTSFIFIYLKFYEKKNILNIFKILIILFKNTFFIIKKYFLAKKR